MSLMAASGGAMRAAAVIPSREGQRPARIASKIALLAFALATFVLTAKAQADESQLEARISLLKSCYSPGEPIILTFVIHNRSDHAVTISTRWAHPSQERIKLIGPDGRDIPPRIVPGLLPPTNKQYVTVPAQGNFTDRLQMDQDTWEHTATGQYSVQANYENNSCDFFHEKTGERLGTLPCWRGRLDSNVVAFVISRTCEN